MLVKQASTLPVREHNLCTFLDRGDLRKLIRDLQPTLEGQCVWVLQATQLSDGLVREMMKKDVAIADRLGEPHDNMGPW